MCQPRNDIILVPLFTGTLFSDIHTMICASSIPPIIFALPIFSLDDVKTITTSVITKDETFRQSKLLEHFETNSTFLFYLHKIGQVPRLLEDYILKWKNQMSNFTQLTDSNIRTIYQETVYDFRQRHRIPDSIIVLLPFAILNAIVSSGHQLFARSLFQKE